MIPDDLRPVCMEDKESILHMVVHYRFASRLWYISPLRVNSREFKGDSLELLWSTLLDKWKGNSNFQELTAPALTIIWGTWKHRNGVVFNQKFDDPIRLRVTKRVVTSWIKVNFDGSFIVKERRGGIGIVCKDNADNFLAARAAPLANVHKALNVEVLAAQEGISMALELGWNKILLEGDSKIAIEAAQLRYGSLRDSADC
ncbi:hypothetical protein Dimus_021073 [Dionaea muscipula]